MLAELNYSDSMATLTIRNLDEKVKRRLQVRAALNGRSMEAEVRDVLSGLAEPHSEAARAGRVEPEEDFGTAIRKLFAPLGGVELQIPPRRSSSQSIAGVVQNAPENVLSEGLGTAIHKLFAPLGGVEIEIPTRRKSHRVIPVFK
jgi:plasmid stability protein